MKFIVVGLGTFGSSLAIRLIEDGHEVIGVDHDAEHVDLHQDKLTHTLKMDSTNEQAVTSLPLSDTDVVVIAIGERTGDSITTAALFKKHAPKCRIIGRATSDILETIFQAMDITEIVNPEAEYADQFANRISIAGTIQSFFLDEKYEIAEFKVPEFYLGKTVQEVDIISNWNVSLITIIRHKTRKNILGRSIQKAEVVGVISGNTEFGENDTLVLFGTIKDIQKMMKGLGVSDE
ncbi:potassium channel family protein [Ekhidna sp.]|uniref:potassium channel family protein n=1 Tax=Ekhidna sp. TaxID=2608089 RepID=UPI003B5A95AC